MRKQRGFSLVEMTIMIAVGSIIFISLGRAVGSLVENAIENRNAVIALNIAKWQMAQINNVAYSTLAVAVEAAQTADPAFPSFIPTREIVSIDTNGSNSIREIRVRVRLRTVTGPVVVYLTTYRSDIVNFGNGV